MISGVLLLFLGAVEKWEGVNSTILSGEEVVYESEGTWKFSYPSGFQVGGPVFQTFIYRIEMAEEGDENEENSDLSGKKDNSDTERVYWWEILDISSRMEAEVFGGWEMRYILRSLFPEEIFFGGMSSRLSNGKELPIRVRFQYPPGAEQEVPEKEISSFVAQHFYFLLLGGDLQKFSTFLKKEKISLPDGVNTEAYRYEFRREKWEIPAGKNKRYRINVVADFWLTPEVPTALAKGKIKLISTFLLGSDILRESYTLSLNMDFSLKEFKKVQEESR